MEDNARQNERMDQDAYMKDSKGRLVPLAMVAAVDQQRDGLVKEILAKAAELQEAMVAFKQAAMDDVAAFVELSAEQYGVKMGGQKGNITLMSFDGCAKVQVAISEHLMFDERLQAAKKLVDECLTAWTEDSRAEIKTIIQDAFQVDKEGRVNTARNLGLRRLAIDDARWIRAMTAIADSMQVVGSKSYLRIYQRENPDGRFEPVALDLAAL
jgi:hypothetical protein